MLEISLTRGRRTEGLLSGVGRKDDNDDDADISSRHAPA